MHEVSPEHVDTILTLPSGTTAADVIARCREVALEFVNTSSGWGKAELGIWLIGAYAPLTKHAPRDGDGDAVWPVPLLREIDVRLIDRIMQSARAEVLDALQRIAHDGSASFVLRALIAGAVVRCEDADRDASWIPTANPSRLADRVLSLFAVDYLARPGDYETMLGVCLLCEHVHFDGGGRRCQACRPANSQSMRAPRRRLTLPYPPLAADGTTA
jgi:hypothetical protein